MDVSLYIFDGSLYKKKHAKRIKNNFDGVAD